MIKVSVLGEFVASYNGTVIPLQPMQDQVIMALLCAETVVSRDRLVKLMWDSPTPGSVKTLNTHLSRIDKAVKSVGGEPEKFIVRTRLWGGHWGYRLAGGLDIDAIRFQQQVAAGCEAVRQDRFEMADPVLAQALSLRTRGEPLLQAAHRPFAIEYVERLEEAYKNGIISFCKAGMALDKHREVLGILRAFSRRWPEERELPVIHVHALYRIGQDKEAAHLCHLAINAVRAEGADDRFWLNLQRDVLRAALPRTGPLPCAGSAAA